jgi:hypothetical protein
VKPRPCRSVPNNPPDNHSARPPVASIQPPTQSTAPNFRVIHDPTTNTISIPYDAACVREVKSVADWSLQHRAYVIRPNVLSTPGQPYLAACLNNLAKHVAAAQTASDLAHDTSNELNAAQPNIVTSPRGDRIEFPIPAYAEAASKAATAMGASQDLHTPSVWSVLASKGYDLILTGLKKIATLIQVADRNTSLAADIAKAGHPDERLKLSADGPTLLVRVPAHPAAKAQLEAVDFKWAQPVRALTVEPTDDEHAERITATLDKVSLTLSYDRPRQIPGHSLPELPTALERQLSSDQSAQDLAETLTPDQRRHARAFVNAVERLSAATVHHHDYTDGSAYSGIDEQILESAERLKEALAVPLTFKPDLIAQNRHQQHDGLSI